MIHRKPRHKLKHICSLSILLIEIWALNLAQAQEVSDMDVGTILNNRCTVCHGCYDAPCQLKLGTYEGLLRGASKSVVYDQSRLERIAPTRLFIDAHQESQWRELGFFSVINNSSGSAISIFEQVLNLKQQFNVSAGQALPADFPLDISRDFNCPAPNEMSGFIAEHSQFGMPYGMTPLSDAESAVLQEWIDDGFPNFDAPLVVSTATQNLIQQWELFLNQPDDEQQLVSRYLYEHLFLGHLTFDNHESHQYFRLIRSYTPPGTESEEIATRHPNDSPNTDSFFYRFVPIREKSLDKTHFSYDVGTDRLQQIEELFGSEDWAVSRMPGYSDEEKANPFLVFEDIPARIRYKFLLDDTLYYISNFIKGPVCRGQVALNVIPDHFFVGFLAPDFDLSVIDEEFLTQGIEFLGLPSVDVEPGDHVQVWLDRLQAHSQYLEHRDSAYSTHEATRGGFPIEAVWQGLEDSDNNLLTVFRHFDSATVVPGLVGATPKSAWIIDFPTLERIYYDLVVNYDVFGNVSHQVLTRLYMDYLRMESEALFLSFLPSGARELVFEEWYQGIYAQAKVFWAHSNLLFETPSRVDYLTGSYTEEFFSRLQQRRERTSTQSNFSPSIELAHRQLQTLDNNVAARHAWVNWLPELTYVLLYDEHNGLHYTASLLRNKAHRNISFLLFEENRRVPAEDTTTYTSGTMGSYPNYFFRVPLNQVERFVIDLRSIVDAASFASVVESYGVGRTDPGFWNVLDDLHDWREQETGRRDLLDINRYHNL